MVIITGVYVVATILIFVANMCSAKATRDQVTESKRQFEETKRLEHMPYMQVSFTEVASMGENDSFYSLLWLPINPCRSDNCSSSCIRIGITNVGLGLAVNTTYRWISGENEDNGKLSCNLIRQNEPIENTAVVMAAKPENEPQSADAAFVLCFDDYLGNHYEQRFDLSFDIYPNRVGITRQKTQLPVHIVK